MCIRDSAWLLNLRGGDIDHVPVFLSFVSIEKEQILLFVNPQILDKEVQDYLEKNHVTIRPYEDLSLIHILKAVSGDAAAVSMLMDISKRRFSIGKKKGFSL